MKPFNYFSRYFDPDGSNPFYTLVKTRVREGWKMFEHELPANGDYIEINHSGNDPVSRFFRYNDQFLYKIRPDRSIAISLSIKFSRFWRPCRRVRLSVTEAYRGCHAEVTADIADGRYYPVSTNGPAYLCNAIISARNRNQAMVYNHIRKLNLCIREVDA